MRHALILTLLILFGMQSLAASQDLHLLHAASGQHAVHHEPHASHAPADAEQPGSTSSADCQHCCQSHGAFLAQLPLTANQASSLLNRQQAIPSLWHIPAQQHSTLYRPPIA